MRREELSRNFEEGEFILIFDILRKMNTLKTQVWRELQRREAKMIQFSIWKSNKLNDLIDIASAIKSSGKSKYTRRKICI